MTPIRLVTVTWSWRSWAAQRLALNFGRTTILAPAIRAGNAAMNWALPWNNGVTVRYVSRSVSRVRATTSWPKKYIWECGMATPLDGPVVPEVKNTEATERAAGAGSCRRPPAGCPRPAPASRPRAGR